MYNLLFKTKSRIKDQVIGLRSKYWGTYFIVVIDA